MGIVHKLVASNGHLYVGGIVVVVIAVVDITTTINMVLVLELVLVDWLMLRRRMIMMNERLATYDQWVATRGASSGPEILPPAQNAVAPIGTAARYGGARRGAGPMAIGQPGVVHTCRCCGPRGAPLYLVDERWHVVVVVVGLPR